MILTLQISVILLSLLALAYTYRAEKRSRQLGHSLKVLRMSIEHGEREVAHSERRILDMVARDRK